MIMPRRNTKFYANIGISGTPPLQLLTILDPGSRPNYIRKDFMAADMEAITEHGELSHILDFNESTILMEGRANFQIELVAYRLILYSIIYERLAALCVLRFDFCNTSVLLIRPKDRLVELDDFSTIPIVRNLTNSTQHDP